MATVLDAISALGITEWVLRGEPTNADEFASMFRKVTGVRLMMEVQSNQTTQLTLVLLGMR